MSDNNGTWTKVIENYKENSELNSFPFVDEVIENFKERNEFGIQKHGIPIEPFSGRNSIEKAKQENLDLIVHLMNSYIECDEDSKKTNIWIAYLNSISMYENLILIEKDYC